MFNECRNAPEILQKSKKKDISLFIFCLPLFSVFLLERKSIKVFFIFPKVKISNCISARQLTYMKFPIWIYVYFKSTFLQLTVQILRNHGIDIRFSGNTGILWTVQVRAEIVIDSDFCHNYLHTPCTFKLLLQNRK